MSAPTPAEFHRTLLDLTLLAGDLEQEYRWVHSTAHARTVTDEAKVQTGGPSDGTSGIVTSTEKARQRRALAHAHERVKDAIADLRRAQSALLHGEERTPERVRFEQLRNPVTATREEVRQSREAQARRMERGEGHGDG
jgi:hypothetical protein